MKTRHFLILMAAGISVGMLILAGNVSTNNKYIPRAKFGYSKETGIAGAMEWLSTRRGNAVTGAVNLADIEKALSQIAMLNSLKTGTPLELQWTELGPDNVGGRTRAILIDKNNTSVMYAGGVSGGLWKSTTNGQSWQVVDDDFANLAVASICQTANGDIYFGTGEGMYYNTGTGSGGFEGQGIWKSSDNGATFQQLVSTWNDDNYGIAKQTFVNVNKLGADPSDNNVVYAATRKGLRVTRDGGATWTNPLGSLTSVCSDVKVSSSGAVIASVGNKAYVSPTGQDGTFESKSGTATGQINASGVGRLEFAYAPSDPNYVYCSAAKHDGSEDNIYQSTDGGNTWTIIHAGVTKAENFLGSQGTYDNVIAVYPDDKEKVIVGGQYSLWRWEDGTWGALSMWNSGELSGVYVHADQHAIVFHPNYASNKIIFVGSDGGIGKSSDGGESWATSNIGYGVTQFYSVSFSPVGQTLGGTQDNQCQYISLAGSTPKNATRVGAGDGGYCEISQIYPELFYFTSYYGTVMRSEARGEDLKVIFNGTGSNTGNPFVTAIRLWESFNDTTSIDSVNIFIDTLKTATDTMSVFPVGYCVMGKSNIYAKPFKHILTQTAYAGTRIKVQDPYQMMLASGQFGNDGGMVMVSRNPWNFGDGLMKNNNFIDNVKYDIGTITTLEFSKDGENLFVATEPGYNPITQQIVGSNAVYRISGLQNARGANISTALTTLKIADFPGRKITSLASDPNNGNNLVVTLGNYDNTNFVYYSINAATTTSEQTNSNFSLKQGNLPEMPVYASCVIWKDSRKIMIGTEYGIFTTADITATSPEWVQENNGFANVPVAMLRQQTFTNDWLTGIYNHGVIYAATHGRGIFKCETFATPVSVPEVISAVSYVTVSVYPNPVVNLANVTCSLTEKSDVTVRVYSTAGKLIQSEIYKMQSAGKHLYNMNCEGLAQGTYFLVVSSTGSKQTVKFIKY